MASDPGLHCLLMSLLWDARHKWVKSNIFHFCVGNPDPLVFHAPQFFFECLQQRISTGNKKKRLPNFTTAFVRKDALPLGTFTKYTWHITNILHVKQIFDTPDVSCCVSQISWDKAFPTRLHVLQANSEQPAHLHRLIRVFAVHL